MGEKENILEKVEDAIKGGVEQLEEKGGAVIEKIKEEAQHLDIGKIVGNLTHHDKKDGE